ncbi:sensor histidine kinase [Curtobacterium sp. VKM Ac-2922]|uniref:sensor histidine kinase n=1 Tax=Curtobacterium sp. VKM Ac-2922 TaxID=2929475 RepID=UPI001FB2CCA7|nr:histidine kinase [Curtobacterium sp. VKM Ac-2922]MCJ1714600.1 histidine kinase [Curtobacterium sp. VKM Ac-2922]
MTTASPAPPRPGALERWAGRHPAAIDVLLVVVYSIVTTGQLLSLDAFTTAPFGATALLVAGFVVGVLRRRAPLAAFVVAGIAATLAVPLLLLPLVLLVVATVVTRVGVRVGWIASAAAVLVFTVVGTLTLHDPSRGVFGAVVLLAGMVLGLWIRTRRAYVQALVDLADRVRAEQEQRAVAAVEDERARIAREMHDVVAHGLSVMIRLADGADALVDKEPERSRDAVQRIGTVGRDSLADMRRVLGVLRTGDAAAHQTPTDPQPSLADLDRLVTDQRAAGLPVTLHSDDVDGLPDSLATTVYRIVQESLTNASRYALDPTTVDVRVTRSGGSVVVLVQDDGRAQGSVPSQGSGRGLVGLRERAALYDGQVEAGPVTPHGWRVRVVLRAGGTA